MTAYSQNTRPRSGSDVRKTDMHQSNETPVLDVLGGFDGILGIGGADILCSLSLIEEALSGLNSSLHGSHIGQQPSRQANHVVTHIVLQSKLRSVASISGVQPDSLRFIQGNYNQNMLPWT